MISDCSTMTKPVIEYHADDYGLFLRQSKRILKCHEKGVLNAVSVMTNSPYMPECMELLNAYAGEIKIAVHLNFIEGKSLCNREEVPLLVDDSGILNISFGKLLINSFLPKRSQYREQLRREIRAQIKAIFPYLESGTPLRIDSHVHYHMIPVVFDALMDVIKEDELSVNYIRIPNEALSLYLRRYSTFKTCSIVNLIKVLVLKVLTWRNSLKYGKYLSKLEKNLALGVAFSGRMTEENVNAILEDAKDIAVRTGRGIEIFAHPGDVLEEEDIAQLTFSDDVTFLTSEWRQKEANMYTVIGRKEKTCKTGQ